MQITLEEIEFTATGLNINFDVVADMDIAQEGGYFVSEIIYPATGLRATMAITDQAQLDKIEHDIKIRAQTMADESPRIYDNYDGAKV